MSSLPPPKKELRTVAALAALAKEAAAGGNPEEAERLLREAADQTTGFHDWDVILENTAPSLPNAIKKELVSRAQASAAAREEIWGYKTCAIYQARELIDRTAARATLHDAEQMLAKRAKEGRGEGFQHGFLATAFKDAVDDDVSALAALEAGWDIAWKEHNVEHLGRLVNFWQKLIDKPTAVARMHRVEQAAREWDNLGGVIYWWWEALKDADAGRRVRQAVLDTSKSFDQVLDLVRYWHLYEKESAGIEAAFARAESLAKTASELFELARQAQAKDSEKLARDALDQAAKIATASDEDRTLKVQIANAYLDWFSDKEAAERVGPLGVRPADLPREKNHAALATKLDDWPTSSSDLFDWLRARATAESLNAIAKADYGHGLKEHLEALERICKSGLVPFELSWYPGEVVELTRWSVGENVDHTARALCCTLLCLASNDDELANTGPPLVESCLALGDEAVERCERLLAWHHETTDKEAPESQVSLLLLVILRAARSPNDAHLAMLLNRINESEHLGTLRELMAESLRADLWTELTERVSLAVSSSGVALVNTPSA